MPQLDTSYFLSQIFWLILTFAALYFYLKIIILPRLEGVISRRAFIGKDDIALVTALQSEILLLQQKIIKEAHDTNEEVAKLHKDAMEKIHVAKQERLGLINESFAQKHKQVTAEISIAKKEALVQMQCYVIDYASLMLSKIAGIKPDTKALKKLYLTIEGQS